MSRRERKQLSGDKQWPDWIQYWNRDPPIYVNERHKVAHYRRVAQDIVSHLPHPGPVVLDYGCGEALSAETVASRCCELFLYDAAPRVREQLRFRFSAVPRIAVLQSHELEQLTDQSIDLIVANSVVQYVSHEEFCRLLVVWRRQLSPRGRLILGDVVRPRATAFDDTKALLAFARQNRFLIGAMVGIARIFVSDYRKMRKHLGFSHFEEQEMTGLLGEHGFVSCRLPVNFGYNPTRMSFQARPA